MTNLLDYPPANHQYRLRAVFGMWKARCECGWETLALPEREFARKQVRAHLEYMEKQRSDLPPDAGR